MPTEYREKFPERHAAAVQSTNQHKDDCQPLEGPMVKAASRTPKSVRPASEAWARDMGAPMSTTMKDDYKAWATGRRAAMVPQQPELERPTGPFAKITTFRSSYTPKVAQRAVSFKPRPTPLSRGHWLEEATAEQVRRCPVQDDGSTPPTGFQYHSVGAGGHRLYRTRD
ncbi:unnamed protein product [Merluccius merluccius]